MNSIELKIEAKNTLTVDFNGTVIATSFQDDFKLEIEEGAKIDDLFTINPRYIFKVKPNCHEQFTTDLIVNRAYRPIVISVVNNGSDYIIQLLKLDEAMERLKQQIQMFEQMIDLVPHALFLKDSQRRFIIINQAVAKHHDLKIEHMVGKRDEDFFSIEDAQDFIADEEKVLDSKLPLNKGEESFTVNGKTKYMETIKLPFFIEHRNEWGILGIALDITQRKKLQEQQTNLKLEHQNHLMRAVVETQEREREKIAQDLHDGLGQILSAASLHLDGYITGASNNPRENLNISKSLVDQSIMEVRNISKSLLPTILKDFGLEEALCKLAENLTKITGVNIFFSSHSAGGKLEEQTEINLYRITQEVLNNSLKHAKSTEISLQLFIRDDELLLQIEDDGVGFNLKEKLREGKGLGLRSIHNRASLINADLEIDTQPNHGCLYSIIVKLTKENHD